MPTVLQPKPSLSNQEIINLLMGLVKPKYSSLEKIRKQAKERIVSSLGDLSDELLKDYCFNIEEVRKYQRREKELDMELVEEFGDIMGIDQDIHLALNINLSDNEYIRIYKQIFGYSPEIPDKTGRSQLSDLLWEYVVS